METIVSKNFGKGWSAKTRVDFDGDQKLTVSTYKSHRALVTYASVSLHRPDGVVTHAIYGDYSKRVLTSATRATEATVTAQQAEVLRSLDHIIADARAHYAKGAKGAQHFENLKAKAA